MRSLLLVSPFLTLLLLSLCGCPSERRTQACDPPCVEHLQTCVEGVCRDLDCDPPCRGGRVCLRGFCVRACDPADPATCGLDEVCCDHLRACVNTDTDFYNCGGCDSVCPTIRSNSCSNGFCGCSGWSGSPCPDGDGCCPREEGSELFECMDLRTDPENCGSCGHSCGDLQCDNGECRCSTDEPCPSDETCCPNGCRNTSTDAQNCGECGSECDDGEDCCNGECVNTLIDLNNCGDCSVECRESEVCCIGGCTDTQSDPYNCGDCFVDCGASGSCSGGSCE